MEVDILLTVFGVSIIQSLFGVGVLLFGTPLLLLLDYPFLESLLILLPISASINVMQVAKDYKDVELTIYRNILFFTIPCIVLFLVLVSKNTFNMHLLMGLLILFIALKERSRILQIGLNKLLGFNKLFYATLGVMHGMTNLGGVLLAAKVFHTPLNKHQKRVTIALSYMTFALFQIVTILALDTEYQYENIGYIGVGLAVYFGVNKFLFHRISEGKYNMLLSIFLALTGLLLVGKGMQWSFG